MYQVRFWMLLLAVPPLMFQVSVAERLSFGQYGEVDVSPMKYVSRNRLEPPGPATVL